MFRRRVALRAFLVVGLGLGLAIWLGRRTPVDFHRELLLEGSPSFESIERPTFRVASFNIHGGKGRDDRRDLSRTAALIRELDLVALHEVHGGFSGNQAAELAARLDMAWLFAPTEREWWHDWFGNGLLSRVALEKCLAISLPRARDKSYRGAVLTSFRHRQVSVQALIAHVDSQDNEIQLRSLFALFLSLREPAVLLGDLNARAWYAQIQTLLAKEGVVDALGTKLGESLPSGHVEWILVRGLRPVTAGVEDNGASDHPLVWAELALE